MVQIPEKIKIKREEDYHTHYVGSYAGDRLFVGFPFFAEINQNRPLAVLHLFDLNGRHIETRLWEADKMSDAEASLIAFLNGVPGLRFHDVSVSLFSVRKNGLNFGLMPCQETNAINYEPYGLSFSEPWDGTYDT